MNEPGDEWTPKQSPKPPGSLVPGENLKILSRHASISERKALEGEAMNRKGEGRQTDNTEVPAQGGMRRHMNALMDRYRLPMMG